MNLTDQQVTEMAEAVLATHEVTPISHTRKCEVAREHCADEFGIMFPRKSVVLLAVKLADLGWAGMKAQAKREINRS